MKNPRYVVAESLNEVTDKEINMAKKLSKDMEKVKKGYQQIAKSVTRHSKIQGSILHTSNTKCTTKVLSLIENLTP